MWLSDIWPLLRLLRLFWPPNDLTGQVWHWSGIWKKKTKWGEVYKTPILTLLLEDLLIKQTLLNLSALPQKKGFDVTWGTKASGLFWHEQLEQRIVGELHDYHNKKGARQFGTVDDFDVFLLSPGKSGSRQPILNLWGDVLIQQIIIKQGDQIT